jgi:hypothetical protein
MTKAATAAKLKNISPFDEIVLEIEDLFAEARNWADGTPIENQAQCDALDKLDKALLDAGKRLDALRVEEKRPLDEQVQQIQDRYNPFIQPRRGKVDVARSALNPVRAAWKEAERKRKEQAALQARIEAEQLRDESQRLMQESAGNLEARIDAEHMLDSAKLADKGARQMEKAATTNLGLRTTYRPELTDLSAATKHYWSTRREDFVALLMTLAEADVRAGKRMIPGFEIHEEKRAL